MPHQQPRYHFDLRKHREAGVVYYSFVLAGKHLPVRPNLKEARLWLVDIVRLMPNEIEDKSGLKSRVKLVLKIYANVPEKRLKAHRDRKRYERLLRGVPAKMSLSD